MCYGQNNKTQPDLFETNTGAQRHQQQEKTPHPYFLPVAAQATTDQADWCEREGRRLLQVEDILAPYTECGPQVGANHLHAVSSYTNPRPRAN